MRTIKPALVLSVLLLQACSDEPIIAASECINELSVTEAEQGWFLLFDGYSLKQWRSYQEDQLSDGWQIENGCLARVGRAGDIITREMFGNFELSLEWRISESGNSGIFVRGDEVGGFMTRNGLEMQILDNAGHFDARFEAHRAGDYYDMIAAPFDTTRPPLSWNHARIIADGSRFEFWLNGQQTAAFDTASAQWQALKAASKFADMPDYGQLPEGHIGLQYHFDKVWFRNIKLRRLPAGAP